MSHWSLLAQFPTSPRCWRFVFMRNTAHPLQFSFIEITQQHHTLHAELRFYPESFCCNKWFVCVRFLERRKRINATTFINGADAATAHYFWAASFNMCVVWIGTAFMLFCATMVGSLLKGRRYGCTKGSVCVCAKVLHFPPSPFLFWELHNFWFSKATTLLLLLTTHILAHRHSWQHGCRLLWSRGCPLIYHHGDISQRVSLKYSSDPLNGKCGLNETLLFLAIIVE